MCRTNKMSKLLIITILIITMSFCVINNAYAFDEETPIALHIVQLSFPNTEALLMAIAGAKFGEIPSRMNVLAGIREFYLHSYIMDNLEMRGVSIISNGWFEVLHWGYGDDRDEHFALASVEWMRHLRPHEANANIVVDRHGSGEVIGQTVVEQNGIRYYIIERVAGPAWVVVWTQFDQVFMATLDKAFTKEEVLAFCYLKEMTSWELEGSAISIAIEGMGSVRIFDDKGNELFVENVLPTIHETWRDRRYILYQINYDGAKKVVGYRFLHNEYAYRIGLIDVEPRRYQYILKPGIYTFYVEGVSGEADLLVKHFYDHEVVSYKNFAQTLAEQSANQFLINVDSFEVGKTLHVGDDLRFISLAIGSPMITEVISGKTSTMDVKPQIQNGRTLIPVRFIAEKLGADVNWNAETRTATILLDEQELSMTIGKALPGMDIPAQIIDNRTMVPLRFVAEHFDATVNWNPVTRTIGIVR